MQKKASIVRAPTHWSAACTATESKLHQLSPYIGKLKSTIASDLLRQFTKDGDLVLDPFCGSGTIPLEAIRLGRRCIASDSNPYAVVLAKAKLHAPATLDEAMDRLHAVLGRSKSRPPPDLRCVPLWVRRFFHPQTLKDAIRFADECGSEHDHFLMACFLGILHHQRPGFLSYPSSHLVPYLRTRKFPRRRFPELYEYRELYPRMVKKVSRALAGGEERPRLPTRAASVRWVGIERLRLGTPVDAILTSPPYMNALDYVRDNRLRMWFVDRNTLEYSRELTDAPSSFDSMVRALALRGVSRLRVGGHCVLVVGETVTRKRMNSHPAERMVDQLAALVPELRIEQILEDEIPDVRRARRDGNATKKELILVLRKGASPGGVSRTSPDGCCYTPAVRR